MQIKLYAAAVAGLLASSFWMSPASAETFSHCGFDTERMAFRGAPVEQARCLLSPVLIGGNLGPAPTALGAVLEERVGRPVAVDRDKLHALLTQEGLDALAAGLDRPVASTSEGRAARYFVIHDTSQKYPGSTFPSDQEASLNRLGFKHEDGTWVAHTFLNRKGEILVAYDFSKPWRATRLEGRVGPRSRGLFLHVEHNQPRLRDPDPRYPAGNDRLAPEPGFTPAQYDRSALLYIVASRRAGTWLIPAFHGVMDKGVGSHDDPQRFDRASFELALSRRLQGLEGAASPVARVTPLQPLRASLYYTALQSDYAAGTEAAFLTRNGTEIARASNDFVRKAEIEGSAKLSDGRVINVDGSVGGQRRWRAISQSYGLDALGCGLIPFRSVAVDWNTVPRRTILYLPETVGMPLPDGQAHDGVWYAVDTGSAITGDRIDLFLGAGRAAMEIPRRHGIDHLQPLQAERRGSFSGCPPS